MGELDSNSLGPQTQIRRRVDTYEIGGLERWGQATEIDFVIPASHAHGRCFVPAAFFAKGPTAPDLRVEDRDGSLISVPTRDACMEMTTAALRQLVRIGTLSWGADPDAEALVDQIVRANPFVSRVAHLELRDLDRPSPEMTRLLNQLEDHYLLWVPISGKPNSEHRFRISRVSHRGSDRIIRPTVRRQTVQVALADVDETVDVAFLVQGSGYRLDGQEISRRLANCFGIIPVSLQLEVRDSHRFESYHIRVRSSADIAFRDLFPAPLRPKAPGPGTATRKFPGSPSLDGLSAQGLNDDEAHVHVARRGYPNDDLKLKMQVGLAGSVTSLWFLIGLLTSVLILALELNLAQFRHSDDADGQIPAAILLLIPVLAAAWAIRAGETAMSRYLMSGLRSLLVASAALAIAAALALAAVTPWDWKQGETLEVLASLSYFVTLLLGVGWVTSQRWVWAMFRTFLTTSCRRQMAIVAAIVVAGVAAAHPGLWSRWTGIALLGLSLVCAAIGGLSWLGQGRGPRSPAQTIFGLLSSAVLALAAGHQVGVYSGLWSLETARDLSLCSYVAILLASAIWVILRRA